MPDAPGLELIRGEIEQRPPRGGAGHQLRPRPGGADRRPGAGPRRARAGCATRPGQEYRFLSSLHAADYLPAEPRFGVHYELLNRDRVERIRVKAMLADPGRASDAAGDRLLRRALPDRRFQEREAYDFFGIVFRGHPDLTRILLPEDYVGWPQRRDFPVGGEPVTFTYNERQLWLTRTLGRGRRWHRALDDSGDRAERGDDRQHRAAPPGDPRRAAAGRRPRRRGGRATCRPVIGYVHTGIEKSCEDKSYWKVIPFVERMDYVSYFFQMEAFCGAVERLVELEIPPRAKYLRTIFLELNRIHSHLVWLGTTALDLGAISMLWYCFRERDRILDLFEMATGQRMHTRYFQVGGVIEDIPLGFEEKLRAFVEEMPVRVGQYEALLDRNEVFLSRTKDVGIVSRERLLELGVTGPLLRAAGEPWDLRKAFDYLAYPELDFKIPVGTVGDNYDRYRVRVAEMVESTRIIEPGARRPARGPLHRRRPQVRAAAALGALDLDGVADPPLQARHRGLPGARPARSTTRSRARAASSAASSSPTARRSRRGSTSATPPSSTCRPSGTCRSTATSPT